MVFRGQGTAQFFLYTTSIIKVKVTANYILWLQTFRVNICKTDENWDRKPFKDRLIGVENIKFQYKQQNTAKVLWGISMKIKAETHTAVVEPFSCSKSTIILLLKCFYDSTSDCITLNRDNISLMSSYVLLHVSDAARTAFVSWLCLQEHCNWSKV